MKTEKAPETHKPTGSRPCRNCKWKLCDKRTDRTNSFVSHLRGRKIEEPVSQFHYPCPSCILHYGLMLCCKTESSLKRKAGGLEQLSLRCTVVNLNLPSWCYLIPCPNLGTSEALNLETEVTGQSSVLHRMLGRTKQLERDPPPGEWAANERLPG